MMYYQLVIDYSPTLTPVHVCVHAESRQDRQHAAASLHPLFNISIYYWVCLAAASLFPPRLWFTSFSLQVSAAAPRSCRAAPLPFLPFSFSSRPLLSFARLFSFQLAASKEWHQTPPINHNLYHLYIFFFFTPPNPSPPLLQMMHVLRGEHFHVNRLTVSNKEDGSASQEKGTGRFTCGGFTYHF